MTRMPSTVITRDPETPAATVSCPNCTQRLVYERSFLSGLQPLERWDQFACGRCGNRYELRLRTHELRFVGGRYAGERPTGESSTVDY